MSKKGKAKKAETVEKQKRVKTRSLAQMFKASFVEQQDPWGGTPVSPDVYITQRQPVLVARSREQWSNNDYVRNFIRLVHQNIVGPSGIQLQAKAKKPRGGYDKEANEAIERAWGLWSKKGNCDVTGYHSWRNFQALAVKIAARDGEFLIRKCYGSEFGPFGFSLQMLDPQRLSVRYENARFGENGNFIRQGIEFNQYGKPIAYHFTSTDEWDAYYYSVSGRGFVRIPANQIIHGFVQDMAGQRRGLPWVSTSLFRLHNLQGFEDAAVQNARASASKMGFIQWKEGFGPECDENTDAASMINAEPLSFHELPEGAELAEWSPQYPSGEFQSFHKAMLRGAAAGMGVLYNNMAGDLEGVNFSSIRQGTLDEREHWKECQQWLIEELCQVVFDEWLKLALLSGLIIKKNGQPLPPEKIATYQEIAWQPRRWAWIDPRADVDGAVTSIRAGLSSPSKYILEQGLDPQEVFAEIADDIQSMKDAGLDGDMIQLFFTGQMPAPEPAEPDTTNKPNDKTGGDK